MFITALDIGTSNIKVLVARTEKGGKLSLAAVFKAPSAGIRKGEIINVEELVNALKPVIDGIKQVDKSAAKNIFVNIGGGNIRIQNSRGIVAVSRADSEICAEDVDRAIKASQAINLGPNRMIVHTITKEFVVDGIGDIIDPLGMVGNRLEINSLIVDCFKPTLNNLIKALEASGGKIGGIIYNPLASARSVLNKNQKELGVALIDIGFGTTNLAVYQEGKLVSTATFPIGASHITNDLAIGLRCPIKTAEKIKLSFGAADSKEVSGKEKIDLHGLDDSLSSTVNKRFISEIIEIRLSEIFEHVSDDLKSINKNGELPSGAVIVGGGAKMTGVLALAKKELKLPVQAGDVEISEIEFPNSESAKEVEDPEFAVAVGLLLLGSEQSEHNGGWSISGDNWFSKVLSHLLP
ncbi:MAG: cell division protein FtsA [Candidatus Paceibacterota bacterium]